MLTRQSNDGVWVRLEVEPPRRIALVPAVHRQRDEVRPILEVADDDAAGPPGPAADGGEAERTPAPLVRRGPQEPAATQLVQRAMGAPRRVHEPRRRDSWRSSWRVAHGTASDRPASTLRVALIARDLAGARRSARQKPEDFVDHPGGPEQSLEDREDVLPERVRLLPEPHPRAEDAQPVNGASACGTASVAHRVDACFRPICRDD